MSGGGTLQEIETNICYTPPLSRIKELYEKREVQSDGKNPFRSNVS